MGRQNNCSLQRWKNNLEKLIMTLIDKNHFSGVSVESKFCAYFLFNSSKGFCGSFEDYSTFVINVIKRSFIIKHIQLNEIVKDNYNTILNSQYFISSDFFFYGLDFNNEEKLELITYKNITFRKTKLFKRIIKLLYYFL